MAEKAEIKGLESVLAGFWKVRGSTAKKAERALKRAGAALLRMSQKLVPVEFGPLKASGFVRADGSGFSTRITVGYTASYALNVHEKVGMVLKGQPRRPSPPHIGHYWDPKNRGQAKFLEQPARDGANELRKLIYSDFLKP